MHPVVDLGPPDGPGKPAAPVVLLLHGQPGLAAEWFRVVELLTPAARVVAPERPGYDGWPERATDWRGNAAAALAMLDDLSSESAVVVAFSWATGAALELAHAHPERVRGLVLVGSVGAPGSVTLSDRLMALPGVWQLGRVVLDRLGPRLADVILRWSASQVDAQTRSAFRAVVGLWHERGVWRAAAAEQRFLVRDEPGLEQRVAQVDVPVVVVAGAHDPLVPLYAAHALVAALPQARLVTVDAGHLVHLEDPQAVADAVLELLAGTAP